MAAIPGGSIITWEATQPSGGCYICRLHRRGTNESKSNGTTGHIRIDYGIQICGDCAQQIRALAP